MKLPALASLALLVLAPAAAAQEALFDNHVHLWKGAESLRAYREQSKAAGFDPVAAVMWFGGPNQAREGNPEAISASNDAIVALAKANAKLVPVATVHPYDGEAAIAEVRRIGAAGVKLLKIHAHTQKFDNADPRVLAVVRAAGEAGVVVLMDNANILPGDNEKLFNLALSAPKTKFIFAHMGAMGFRFWNMLKAARTAEGLFGDNIYFDISATVTLAADAPIEDEFVWTMRNVGIDHILLGSDYPQFSLAQNVAALAKLGLTAEEVAKIRYGNARKLLGLAD